MDFEYYNTIYIYSEDLRKLYLEVKKGKNFEEVYYNIMAKYEDDDYSNCHLIIDQVKEEINRRLEQSKG